VTRSAGQAIGPYLLRYRLGAGGMAEVWAATHRTLGVTVALKLLSRGTPAMQERLLREGRVQSAMDHPNILPVRDFVEHDGVAGLIMPLVEGPTLDALLATYRPTVPEALALFVAIAEGVHHAHEHGLVHRDLKPTNLLLGRRWGRIVPLVADFGLVKDADDTGLTLEGAMLGTLHHAAPEQLLDAAHVDHRADLFSLGVILVELLAGHRPFVARSLGGLLEAHRGASDLAAVPGPYRPLCRQLLAIAPARRLPSTAALLAALASAPRDRLLESGALARAVQACIDARPPPPSPGEPRTVTPSDGTLGGADSRERDPPLGVLPAARDPFVGRRDDLDRLGDLLEQGRLVSILGTGGVGKTRLALHFARAQRGSVYFCSLVEARTREGILTAVGKVLGVPPSGDDLRERIGHALAARGRALLVLDNFEQIAAHAEDTVGRWMELAPAARFVVTTRARLDIDGEQVLNLAPLSEADAFELFVTRAQAKRASFAPTDRSRDDVRALVEQLDRLPLAIELAAVRIRVMSPAMMRERMGQRFELLSGGRRGTAHRQATLRSTIDWSWALLTDWEKSALAQCAVFEGGFALEAAEAILDLTAHDDAPWPMEAIQSLVDKSLLRLTGDDHGPPRFEMLQSLHDYAREKLRGLAEPGGTRSPGERGGEPASPHEPERDRAGSEEAECRRRHLAVYAALGEPRGREALDAAGGGAQWERLWREVDNLAAANRFAMQDGRIEAAVQTAHALAAIAELRQPGLAVPAFLALHELPDERLPEAPRARVELALGRLLGQLHRAEDSERHYTNALHRARRIGDARLESMARRGLGTISLWRGRPPDAEAHFREAVRVGAAAGDVRSEGRALGNLGITLSALGRVEEASECLSRAIRMAREIGDRRSEGNWLRALGIEQRRRGRLDEAEQSLWQAMRIAGEFGDRPRENHALASLGMLYELRGQLTEAERCSRQALKIARDIGYRLGECNGLGFLGLLVENQGRTAEAEACLREAVQTARSMRFWMGEGHWRGELGRLLGTVGRFEAGREELEAAAALLHRAPDSHQRAVISCYLADDEHRRSRFEAAEEALAEAERIAVVTRSGPGSVLGKALAATRSRLRGDGG